MRIRAIRSAFSYGIRPWWMYEDESHYAPMTYLQHLRLNLAYAWSWMTFRETEADRAFEREVNAA